MDNHISRSGRPVDDAIAIIHESYDAIVLGKGTLASAITAKGVPTLATDTFSRIAFNIGAIQTSPVTFWYKHNTITGQKYRIYYPEAVIPIIYRHDWLPSPRFVACQTIATIDEGTGVISYSGYFMPTTANYTSVMNSPAYYNGYKVNKISMDKSYESGGEQWRYSVYYNGQKLGSELATVYTKGSFVDIVHSADVNAYPVDGKHTDGYWYTRYLL